MEGKGTICRVRIILDTFKLKITPYYSSGHHIVTFTELNTSVARVGIELAQPQKPHRSSITDKPRSS